MDRNILVLCTVIALTTAAAGAVSAATTAETFKKWSAKAEEVDTGEDIRKTCTAVTSFTDGQGKKWTATFSISNGDVLPPDGYPSFEIAVAAGKFPEGENVPAVFTIDQAAIKAAVHGGGAKGATWMMNNTNKASTALFRGMAKGSSLDFALNGKSLVKLPIDGFAKAYRKLGDWCGYKTGDIVR